MFACQSLKVGLIVSNTLRGALLIHSPKKVVQYRMTAGCPADNQEAPGLLKILEANRKRLSRINFLSRLYKTAGFELRIAGGAVRDILTGVEPKDIDFATTALPEQSLDILQKHENILRIIVTASGQRHGTVAVKFKETQFDLKKIRLEEESSRKAGDETRAPCENKPEYDDESPFEITTLRCDSSTDGRHAEVTFVSDWKTDAERRDLTINAMFLTLHKGELIDYFNGETDLREGRVRFVGDAALRLQEDYLRILRYFRFWNRYSKGNPPDAATIEVIESCLPGLEKISGERIWQEMKKIFSHLPCSRMVELMVRVKLPKYIGLEDEKLQDYESYQKFVTSQAEVVENNLLEFTRRVESSAGLEIYKDKKISDLKPVIMFSCLVESSEMCLNAWKRMRFSNNEKDVLLNIAEHRLEDTSVKELKHRLALSQGPERFQMRTKIITLLICRGEFDKLEEIYSWTIPSFPISGVTISQETKKRKLAGQKIKLVQEHLKNLWADSEFKISLEDLKQEMHSKLDEFQAKDDS